MSAKAATAACLALVVACADDAATGIATFSVNLLPDSADVVAGQEIRMQAVVVDLFGKPLEKRLPEWESTDPSIATVDATGAVRGRAEGLVEIRASIPGAEDVSRVRVLPHPRIVVSEPAIRWGMGAGGPAPSVRTVSISNGGAGTLGTLELVVRHVPESPRWLVAVLVSPTTPSAMELSADTDQLASGTYEATVIITSDSTGVEPVEVPVSLILADFSLEETGELTAVPEGSGADTVLVVLHSAPSAPVFLSVGVTGASASASPLRLGFAPDDWSTPRVVSVSGVDDDAVGGDQVSELTVAVDVAASDSAFHGIPAKTLQVTTLDDDQAGIRITESDDGTSVTESGATDDFTVALAARPLTDVRLTVASTAPGEATVAPAVLTFAPSAWSIPQTVTVRGIDDPDVDGDRASTLTIAVDAALSDDAFHGLAESITVTTEDDDTAGLVVEESSGETVVTEGGVTDDLMVSLTARPQADVVLQMVGDDPSEVVATPGVLRFTRSDWQSPRAVTIQGVEDAITDGPQTSTVTLSIDQTASDDAFSAVPDRTIRVTTLDVDTIGVSEASSTGYPSVSSAGLVAAYNLTTLTSQGLLRDFGGRDLHGTISGTSVVAAPRGGGLLFQVATDRVELPARSDFDLDGPLSVVARIRVDVPRRHQHVLACDDKFGLALREADQVRFSNTRGDLAETLVPLSTGEWHTVIGVFRGTAGDAIDDTNIEIWIDGTRAPIQTISSNGAVPPVWRDGVLHPTDACYIGFESHQGNLSHQNLAFHGAVDEILVFGRALTEQEVRTLSEYP